MITLQVNVNYLNVSLQVGDTIYARSTDTQNGAEDAQHHRLGAVVHDLRAEVLDDLQDLGALVELAGHLDQCDLGLVGVVAGVVHGVHHVDQLGELFDDLLQGLGIARRGDRHAREVALRGRADDQALDVVAAARERDRHARQDARLVVHVERDDVLGRVRSGLDLRCCHWVSPVSLWGARATWR